MKNSSRILAMLLALTMALSLLSVGVFAEEAPAAAPLTEEAPAETPAEAAEEPEAPLTAIEPEEMTESAQPLQAEEPALGTVEALPPNGAILDDAVLFSYCTLNFSAADPAAGRPVDGHWVGVKVTAPEGYTAGGKYGYTEDGMTKSFDDCKDGDYYIGLWCLVTPEYIDYARENHAYITYQYYFDWNADGSYDQRVIIQIDPDTVILDGSSVATVNGRAYSTLAAAIAAAAADEEVTLLADAELTAPVELERDVSIQGANHTISITHTGDGFVAGTHTLNISEAVLSANGAASLIRMQAGALTDVIFTGSAATGVFVDGDASEKSYSDMSQAAVSINNCTFADNIACAVEMIAPASGTAYKTEINNCSFTGPVAARLHDGVDFSNNTVAGALLVGADVSGYIVNNDFTAAVELAPNAAMTLTQNRFLAGGSVRLLHSEDYTAAKPAVSENYWADGYAAMIGWDDAEGMSSALECVTIDSYYANKELWDLVYLHPVLVRGAASETGYENIAAAVAAAAPGDYITLLTDLAEDVVIPAGKTLTLNLNGMTLTNVSGHTITNNGTLTISGYGMVDNVSHQCAAVFNNGTVTLENGTFLRSKEAGVDAGNSGGNSYYILVNHGAMVIENDVTVTVDGHFSSMITNGYYNYEDDYDAAVNSAAPSLVIHGGTFSGGLNTIKNDDGGILAIDGGVFTNMTQSVVFNVNETTINGGTFDGRLATQVVWNRYYNNSYDKGRLTIHGGSFCGPVRAYDGNDQSAAGLVIDGGSFNTNVKDYCKSGYVQILNDAGGYDVVAAGEVRAATAGGSVTGNTVLFENCTLRYFDADPEAGRVTAGYWVSARILAPIGYRSGAYYGTASDAMTVSYDAKADGTGALSMWLPVAENTAEDLAQDWYFDWNADGTADQVVSIRVTAEGLTFYTDAVACIGATRYRTLQAAVSAAADGDTVMLLADAEENITVPLGRTLTLDLNGRTLDGSVSNSAAPAITNNGTLTVVDTGNGGTIRQDALVAVRNVGSLFFNGGSLRSQAKALENTGLAAINAGIGTVTGAVESASNAMLAITGGTFSENVDAYCVSGYGCAYVGGAYVVHQHEMSEYADDDNAGCLTNATETRHCTYDGCEKTESREIPDTAHNALTHVERVAPTAGTAGNIEYWRCEECGKCYADADATREITLASTVLPALGYGGGGSSGGGGGSAGGTVEIEDEDTPLADKPFLFEDVAEDDWFYDAVKFVFNRDIMLGTGDTAFSPDQLGTRGMIVTLLHRMSGSTEPGAHSFTDVEDGAWYAEAVAWAAANGIVKGMTETTFEPMTNITREQMVTILYKFARYMGYDVTASDDLAGFEDADTISDYALEAMQWAVGCGLMKGRSETTLAPDGNAKRCEIAQLVMNFSNLFVTEEPSLDDLLADLGI